jgi:hypothetical protein
VEFDRVGSRRVPLGVESTVALLDVVSKGRPPSIRAARAAASVPTSTAATTPVAGLEASALAGVVRPLIPHISVRLQEATYDS